MAGLDGDWTTRFPILKSKTYLASHSLGAVPASAAGALQQYYREWAEQGIQAWDGPWWNSIGDYSQAVEAVIGAGPATVVPFQNATRAMAQAASTLDYAKGRNRVVLTDLEFTTFYPFWRGQEALGAELVVLESDDRITVHVDAFEAAVDRRTLLVTTCQVYFRSGAIQDLRAIAKIAHDSGALLLGDGYQAVGSMPVDVRALDVDFYVGGCHKYLCGGPGAAFLYVRPDHIGRLRPRSAGWFGLKDPFGYAPGVGGSELDPGIRRFLDGTANVPALYAAREGLREVRAAGLPDIREKSTRLTKEAIRRATALGLDVKSPKQDAKRGGMVCLDFEGSQATVERLTAQGVIVDWRPDCGLRLSPHFYNSVKDLDRFFEALAGAATKPSTGRRRAAAART